jgi:hypothetical protein
MHINDSSLNHYGKKNPFHHGSSDFDVEFLKKISPYATVISSGDNESHSHPRADAIGASGKYSRGEKPKVYSTELARSVKSSGEILYGMINLRSNGDKIYMAQMKESKKPDIWDKVVTRHLLCVSGAVFYCNSVSLCVTRLSKFLYINNLNRLP